MFLGRNECILMISNCVLRTTWNGHIFDNLKSNFEGVKSNFESLKSNFISELIFIEAKNVVHKAHELGNVFQCKNLRHSLTDLMILLGTKKVIIRALWFCNIFDTN